MPPKKRRMLTKPVEKALRADMETAVNENRLTLQENQTIDDVIEYIKQGIKTDQYEPGITFDEWYATLTPAPASSGDEAGAAGSDSDEEAVPEDAEPVDDIADWYQLMIAAKAKIDEAQEMFDLAKKRYIERLTETGKTKATIGGRVVATYTEVSRRQFNKKKFEAEYPDLCEAFTSIQTTHRFDLK